MSYEFSCSRVGGSVQALRCSSIICMPHRHYSFFSLFLLFISSSIVLIGTEIPVIAGISLKRRIPDVVFKERKQGGLVYRGERQV